MSMHDEISTTAAEQVVTGNDGASYTRAQHPVGVLALPVVVKQSPSGALTKAAVEYISLDTLKNIVRIESHECFNGVETTKIYLIDRKLRENTAILVALDHKRLTKILVNVGIIYQTESEDYSDVFEMLKQETPPVQDGQTGLHPSVSLYNIQTPGGVILITAMPYRVSITYRGKIWPFVYKSYPQYDYPSAVWELAGDAPNHKELVELLRSDDLLDYARDSGIGLQGFVILKGLISTVFEGNRFLS